MSRETVLQVKCGLSVSSSFATCSSLFLVFQKLLTEVKRRGEVRMQGTQGVKENHQRPSEKLLYSRSGPSNSQPFISRVGPLEADDRG